MILAKNQTYSLHKLEPDTYVHETYVLVEKIFKYMDYDYRTTLFTVPRDKMERLEKLVRSIKNGANGSDIELYPLHFICGFSGSEKCPANERATALAELGVIKQAH
jgi:hypothetical protein